jgi:hypothetical protein
VELRKNCKGRLGDLTVMVWKDKQCMYISINHQHNATSAENNGVKKSATVEDYSNKRERMANSYSIGEHGSGQKIFHLLYLTILNHHSITLWWQNRQSKISSDFDSKFVRNECKGVSSSVNPKRMPNSQAIQGYCSLASCRIAHTTMCVLSQEETNNFSALSANLACI